MFNIADLPAVQAQLAQDATAAAQSAGAPVALQKESAETQLQQAPGYPSKNLILVNGRYQAVEQKK